MNKNDKPRKGLADWYFSHKSSPYWMILAFDLCVVLFSYLATILIFDGRAKLISNWLPFAVYLLVFLLVYILFFRAFKTYRGIIRYSSFLDLQRVGLAVFFATALCYILQLVAGLFAPVLFDYRIMLTTFVLCTLLMWAVRVLVKTVYDRFNTDNAENVLVYGIGDGGVSLAKSIRSEKPAKYKLKGFISHDPQQSIESLLGEKVYKVNSELAQELQKLEIKSVLVPLTRVEELRSDELLHNTILDAGVHILVEQSMKSNSDSDKDAAYSLRNVKIEDLLPRQQINVDLDSVAKELSGKRIMITGSAGSIGSELVRQIASFKPSELILIDQAETPQHDIRLMMAKEFPDINAHTIITSIDSQYRMRVIFETYRPQYVFHAAAYKHVPMMEDNPSAAVHNNIRGTRNIADLSVEYGVDKFVMVSTDKAVNPTNVMGCSKRICEIYVQSLNKAQEEGIVPGHTQFVTTRFGNVLGSNGSVIPIFKKQIEAGGPVTVTHKDIIRFFMLISEACKLVLEAGTKGKGGEIFVFDMGKPVRIADLAKRMIFLSGAKDVQIEYTGLRDGEKLYEETLSDKETTKPSFHEKIRIADVREYDYNMVNRLVAELIDTANRYNPMEIVSMMKRIVPEYKSNNSVYSVLDK
ncbi:MAG: polysaccharide biosynthesis protein [Candidatus Cryptobacteroides sp.]